MAIKDGSSRVPNFPNGLTPEQQMEEWERGDLFIALRDASYVYSQLRREYIQDDSGVGKDLIDKHFNDGEVVTPESLLEKGLVRQIKGQTPDIKILGKGKMAKKVVIENCKVSTVAKAAIEKAGGSVK